MDRARAALSKGRAGHQGARVCRPCKAALGADHPRGTRHVAGRTGWELARGRKQLQSKAASLPGILAATLKMVALRQAGTGHSRPAKGAGGWAWAQEGLGWGVCLSLDAGRTPSGLLATWDSQGLGISQSQMFIEHLPCGQSVSAAVWGGASFLLFRKMSPSM